MRKFNINSAFGFGIFVGFINPSLNAQDIQNSVRQIASLRYTLEVDRETIQPGDILNYTVFIHNTPAGASPLDSVRAVFTVPQLPDGSLFLDASTFTLRAGDPAPLNPQQPVNSNGQVIWDLGTMPIDSSETIRISFRLADITKISLQPCGENYITPRLHVSFKRNGQIISPGEVAKTSLLTAMPDMKFGAIIGPATAQRGQTLEYTITYSNIGNVGDTARVCVKLPLGTNANNVQVIPSTIGIQIIAADSLCFNVGLVPADKNGKSFTIRVPLTGSIPENTPGICLMARIDSPCDINLQNNVPPGSFCAPVDPLDLLSLTKAASPSAVEVGDLVNYTLIYRTVDPNLTAYNVRISDQLPAGTQFLSANPPADSVFNNTLLWKLDSLTAGRAETLRYSIRVPINFYRNSSVAVACGGTSINNFATITSTGPGGQPSAESRDKMANNSAGLLVAVRPLTDLLELTKTFTISPVNPSATTLQPGDVITFVLRFENRDRRRPANQVIVVDTLPDPNLVNLLQPLPSQFRLEPGNRLVGRYFALAPGEADTVTYRVMIRTDIATCMAQTFFNRAGVRDSLEFDCDLTNNARRNTFSLPPTGDLLALSLTPETRVINTLGPANFTLTYRNTGTIDALNVVVVDTLPSEIAFVSSVPPAQIQDNILAWTIGTLSRGASGDILVTARVRDVVACDSMAQRNRAGISSTPDDCNIGNNGAATTWSLITPLAQQPQLVLQSASTRFTDQNGDGCAEPGEIITARLEFLNQSQTAATQIAALNLSALPGTVQSVTFAPATLASGEIGVATLQLRAGESDQVDSLVIAGQITANGFCARSWRVAYCFKPRARIGAPSATASDHNGNRNGCANEGEPLDVVIVYQNTSSIRADSLDLQVTLSPAGFNFIGSNHALVQTGPASFRMQFALEAGQIDSLVMQISYSDFAVQPAAVTVTASLRISSVADPIEYEATIPICHECYARPNPFIPSPDYHRDGVRFSPNDGQTVEIFDLQGNKLRSLKTNEWWDGKDDNQRNCMAGVYLWVIKGAGGCRGTIVVVR